MTESAISREVQRFLRMMGASVYTTEQGYRKERGGTRTTAGIPDLMVFFGGCYTFAELKTAKGKLTPAQEGFRDECRTAEIPWTLWRSVEDAFDWCVEIGAVEEVGR